MIKGKTSFNKFFSHLNYLGKWKIVEKKQFKSRINDISTDVVDKLIWRIN